MGQRFAPSYANIYMSEWEREALAKCTHKPLIYLRFLDDIFGIWTHDIEHFQTFIKTLNGHHPTIKVKHTIDRTQINFLDTTVFFQPSTTSHTRLHTKVYFKTTDTHALLHKNSYHPKHTFRGIIKSQIIRFHRICSQQSDFNKATSLLFKALRNRAYSKRFLRQIKNSTLASLAPTRSHTPPAPAQVSVTTPNKKVVQGLVPNPNPYPKQVCIPTPTPTLNRVCIPTPPLTLTPTSTLDLYILTLTPP
ncbi:hypothetical protein D5F01_LYC10031 [Larimichthys crocea]|uniref:Helix-turn-helix domain-containing protein n=1 Tax=Larimichthys crocea TaxID=215358 RepID=A0A6G0HF24_LARCR|nr:hypothetical protein D5F01_LYC24314 [Larimichthys crocea]KAE8290458.1 hypothetical protein D5F01_LYC10031 [Larimichthys crocea]